MALAIGQTTEIQGSGSKPYIIKNCGDNIYSCTCPGWRNCKGPVNTKTCKHLNKVNGAQIEAARIATNSGVAPVNAPAVAQSIPKLQNTVMTQMISQTNNATAEDMVAAVQAAGPNKYFTPMLGDVRTKIQERKAVELGRKLRQDEITNLFGPPILLANHYDEDGDQVDPTGWLQSEKLDGVRAYWNGEQFISRQGNVYEAPAWFTAGLPNTPLDGELWMGRQMFQKTISVVKSGPSDRWKDVTYMVFDSPAFGGPFEDRIAACAIWASSTNPPYAKVHHHQTTQSHEHLVQELRRIEALGGEGVMIRKPGAPYEPRRSSTILKVKPFKDAEAEVIGYTPGKNRHKGVVGALEVRMPDGKTFSVGSGLTDAQRRNPPPIGCTITYRYTDTTNDGIPKCGSFVAIRNYE